MKLIIIGCGRMGSGLALRLSQSHHSVTVLDHDPFAFERLGDNFHGHTIHGSALDHDMLVQAGIKKADGVAAVSGNDAINMVLARIARQQFRVPKVIARTHDPKYSEIYRKLGVQTVTNVSLGIERISELLTFSHLDIIHSIGNGEVGIVRYEIPPLLINHQVNELTVPGEIIVISLTRKGKTSIPTLGTVLMKGDIVYLAVEENSVERLKTMMNISGGG